MVDSDVILDEDGEHIELIGDVLFSRKIDGEQAGALYSGSSSLNLGGEGRNGFHQLLDKEGNVRIRIGASWTSPARVQLEGRGILRLGGEGNDGYLFLNNHEGRPRIRMDGGESIGGGGPERICFIGEKGEVRLGGQRQDGSFRLLDESNRTSILMNSRRYGEGSESASINLNGKYATLRLGKEGNEGHIDINDEDGSSGINMRGNLMHVGSGTMMDSTTIRDDGVFFLSRNGAFNLTARGLKFYSLNDSPDANISLPGDESELYLGDLKVRERITELESTIETLKAEIDELQSRIPT